MYTVEFKPLNNGVLSQEVGAYQLSEEYYLENIRYVK